MEFKVGDIIVPRNESSSIPKYVIVAISSKSYSMCPCSIDGTAQLSRFATPAKEKVHKLFRLDTKGAEVLYGHQK